MNAPVSPGGVARASNESTGAVIRFSSHAKMTNKIQIWFSKWLENEKQNSDLFFKVMRKQKTKFISVFQSDAKTKNEIRSSKQFFKVRRKRKKKTKFYSVFQCHAKTKNGYGTWIPFSHAIEKRLALRYMHCGSLYNCEWRCIGVRYTKCELRNCRTVMVSLQHIAIPLF